MVRAQVAVNVSSNACRDRFVCVSFFPFTSFFSCFGWLPPPTCVCVLCVIYCVMFWRCIHACIPYSFEKIISKAYSGVVETHQAAPFPSLFHVIVISLFFDNISPTLCSFSFPVLYFFVFCSSFPARKCIFSLLLYSSSICA